jgi:hypothetical protein
MIKYKLFICLFLSVVSCFWFHQVEVFAMPVDNTDLEESSRTFLKASNEPDWYAKDHSNEGVAQYSNEDLSEKKNLFKKFKLSSFYIGFKNKTSWYLWNRYRKKYGSYEEFKKGFNK